MFRFVLQIIFSSYYCLKSEELKRILVISHDATLTGAPILLLHLLKALPEKYYIDIVLKRKGILERNFSAIGKVYSLKSQFYSSPPSNLHKLFYKIEYFINLLRVIPVFWKADIVFSNTVTNGRLLNIFKILRKRTCIYVHELEQSLQYFSKSKDTFYSFRLSEIVFYPSNAVKDAIISLNYSDHKKLQYLPYYFPANNFVFSKEQKVIARNQIKNKYKIPESAYLIVGMGTVSERKGTRIFLETAIEVIKRNKNIYFFWIGDWSNDNDSKAIENTLKLQTLGNQIIFTGLIDYNTHTLLPFDLFFLTSIEDAYPLVVLEAAYMKVPAICFENSGGIVELLDDEAGYICTYSEPNTLCNEVIRIVENQEDREYRSEICFKKVNLRHSNKMIIESIFKNILN